MDRWNSNQPCHFILHYQSCWQYVAKQERKCSCYFYFQCCSLVIVNYTGWFLFDGEFHPTYFYPRFSALSFPSCPSRNYWLVPVNGYRRGLTVDSDVPDIKI